MLASASSRALADCRYFVSAYSAWNPFADVVREKVDERSADVRSIQRQRQRPAVREERRLRVFFDCRLIERQAECVFGVQQSVEMAARRVRFGETVVGRQLDLVRPDDVPPEGYVLVVRVEHAAHRAAAEADCVREVGGIDIADARGKCGQIVHLKSRAQNLPAARPWTRLIWNPFYWYRSRDCEPCRTDLRYLCFLLLENHQPAAGYGTLSYTGRSTPGHMYQQLRGVAQEVHCRRQAQLLRDSGCCPDECGNDAAERFRPHTRSLAAPLSG